MKRLAIILCFVATCASAQTQHDRMISRGPFRNDQIITITGATPSVGLGNVFKTGNSNGTTITNFTGGGNSQQIQVICGDGNTTIQNNANIGTSTAADMACTLNTVYSFVFDSAQSKWIQSGTTTGGGGGGGGGGGSGSVYSTPALSQTASVGPIGMTTAPAIDQDYIFTVYLDQFNVGTSCTTSGTVFVNLIFTDAATNQSYTQVMQLQNGSLLLSSVPLSSSSITLSNTGSGIYEFTAKASTAVQYSTVYSSGSCSVGQAYNIYPTLSTGNGGGGGGGGGTTLPGLPGNSIQFNSGSAFTGSSNLLWDGNQVILGAGKALRFTNGSTPTCIVGTLSLYVDSSNVLQHCDSTGHRPVVLNRNGGPVVVSNVPTFSDVNGGVVDSGVQITGGSVLISGVGHSLTINGGTYTTDQNPFNLNFTLNNGLQVFGGVKWTVTNTAYAAGSKDIQWCVGITGADCAWLDPLGNFAVPKSVSGGDTGSAGNIEWLQGPLPGVLPNNVGFAAPASVPSGGNVIILPSTPCTGYWFLTNAAPYSTSACTGAPSQYLSSAYTNATTTFSNLMAFSAAASTNYTATCHLVYQGSASTSGPKIQVTGPASPTAVQYSIFGAITASTEAAASAVAYSTSLSVGNAITATTNFPLDFTIGLVNGANAGTVQIQAASQGAGTLTIQPGSGCAIN